MPEICTLFCIRLYRTLSKSKHSLRKYDVISISQDGGRDGWILLPVSYLLMSPPSEGQWRLRYIFCGNPKWLGKGSKFYVDSRDSRRQFTFLFYVTDSSGQSVRVCKQALLSIFGLQNSRGRINNIMTQIVSGSGTPRTDNRGKHSSRPNHTASSIVDDMKNHIDSFPKYDSHYNFWREFGKATYFSHWFTAGLAYPQAECGTGILQS